jgi:hypothetical protein
MTGAGKLWTLLGWKRRPTVQGIPTAGADQNVAGATRRGSSFYASGFSSTFKPSGALRLGGLHIFWDRARLVDEPLESDYRIEDGGMYSYW